MNPSLFLERALQTILAVCALLIFAGSAAAQQGIWINRAPLPIATSNTAAAVVDRIIYVTGACCPGTGATYAYNPATNRWTSKAAMPVVSFDPNNSAALGGLIYHVGGNASGFCTNLNQVYDPSTDHWTTATAMPTPRCHLAVVADNGLIYAIGGTNTSGNFDYDNVEVYDPATDSWTSKSPLPISLSDVTAAIVHGIIYVVAGDHLGSPMTTVRAYDPASDTWRTMAPIPAPLTGVSAGAINGLIYVVAGSLAGIDFATNEVYDPETNSWNGAVPLSIARSGAGSAVISNPFFGDRLYVIGGTNSTGQLSSNVAFTPCFAHR